MRFSLAISCVLIVGGLALAQQGTPRTITTAPAATPPSTPLAPPGTRLPPLGLSADLRPQYWFGVAVEYIPDWMSRQLQLNPDQGLLVTMVFPGSPAEKAGLKADDVLTAITIGEGRPEQLLINQEQLLRAANTKPLEAAKPTSPVQISRVVYLREGKHNETRITPELRPTDVIVMGDVNNGTARTILPPNGSAVTISGGYHVELKGSSAEVVMIRDAMGSKNETVVYTQEADPAGNTRTTLQRGNDKYLIEVGKLENVPADLRPLAQKLLNNTSQMRANGGRGDNLSIERQLRQMQQENEELRQALQQNQQQLQNTQQSLEEIKKMLRDLVKEKMGPEGGK